MIEKAIISPCSTCKNQRAENDGWKPACPRRRWIALSKAVQNNGGTIPASMQAVLLTGTEGTDSDGTDSLRNPVYSESDSHILVWVAPLKDNPGVYADDGSIVSPPIGQEGFDTDFIQCAHTPYSVNDTTANYFAQGSYRENDLVQISGTPAEQLTVTEGDITDFDPIKVAGIVKKIDFPGSFELNPRDKDLMIRGA